MQLSVNNIKFNNKIFYSPKFTGKQKEEETFEESLKRTYVPTGFLQGYNEIKGQVNGKPVKLKEMGAISPSSKGKTYEGAIDDKPVTLFIEDDKITGQIEEKKIEFGFSKNDYNEFYLRGTVGSEYISVTDNSPINDVQTEKDLIITILSLMGYSIRVKDDKVQTLGFSMQSKEDRMTQKLPDWQVVQQNQILAQSYSMAGRILERADELKGETSSDADADGVPSDTDDEAVVHDTDEKNTFNDMKETFGLPLY